MGYKGQGRKILESYVHLTKTWREIPCKTNTFVGLEASGEADKSPLSIFQEILNCCDSLRLRVPCILSSAFCISFQSLRHSHYWLQV